MSTDTTTTEKKPREKTLKRYTCANCGVEILSPHWRKFCSGDCLGEYATESPSEQEIREQAREIKLANETGTWTDSLD